MQPLAFFACSRSVLGNPITEYIQDTFGMHYAQDESYYILDVKQERKYPPVVYLGCKKDVKPEKLRQELIQAQITGIFNPNKFINTFQVHRHDHFLIPAGTIHCAGKNCMILEVSATPYIFTFKLWDWGRVGLDGKPRPLHIAHGLKNIQYERDTDWVKHNLVNQIETVSNENGVLEERTGLHKLEFIETHRFWASTSMKLSTNGEVNVLNLIEGEEAIIESPNHIFNSYVIHYAETFIVPASVYDYTITPHGPSINKRIGILKAYVRL